VTTAEQAVDAIQDRFGRYPAARAMHAKGTLCRGVFKPSAEAGALTTAAHLHRSSVKVTVRFSNASTKPDQLDGARGPRGMATRFHLDEVGTEYTDIVAVSLPRFFVRTAPDFIELTRSRGWRAAWFFVRHPTAARVTVRALTQGSVPSYANRRYNALHTFRWIEGGQTRYVRYSWIPHEGEKRLRGAKKRERDYLQQDLQERLGRTPPRSIKFDLLVQLASVDDELFDVSATWASKPGVITLAGSGERRERFVNGGVLEVTEIDYDTDARSLGHFDPTHVTDGIEAPEEDEILHLRPKAYDVSFDRRIGKAD
jgi:catalase